MAENAKWWQESLTLEAMIANKGAFLASPGSSIDFDAIASELDSEAAETELADLWFERVVELLKADRIVLHRHQTVADVPAYVERLESGSATVGVHWSLDEGVSSPDPDQSKCEIMLRGTIEASQVEWLSTFQAMFSHPWERQVWFEGPILLDRIQNLETGEIHVPEAKRYPISVEEPEGLAPTP